MSTWLKDNMVSAEDFNSNFTGDLGRDFTGDISRDFTEDFS